MAIRPNSIFSRVPWRIQRWGVVIVVIVALGSWMAYDKLSAALFVADPASNVSSVSGPGDWAMFQRDPSHSGFVPEQRNRLDGTIRWIFKANAPFLSSPSVIGSHVYMSTGDRRIMALDAESGDVLWEYPVTGPVDSSPAIAGETLYVGLRDGRVLALNRHDGTLRWQFQTGNPIFGSTVVYKGVLYIGSGSEKLFALDAATGKERWNYAVGGWLVTSPVVNDKVVAVTGPRNVHIVGVGTASNRLLHALGAWSSSSPALYQNKLFVADDVGRLRAIDWRKTETSFGRFVKRVKSQLFIWGILSKPPKIKGLVWVYTSANRSALSTPVVDSDKVYVSSATGQVYALDVATGREVWRFDAEAAIEGPPSVAQDTVFVGDRNGNIYLLDSETGLLREAFKIKGAISNTVVIAGDSIYLTTEDGTLYSLE